MATLKNGQLSIDAYHFDSVGNAFTRKETVMIPLPAEFVPCAPGPDNQMRVYTKIVTSVDGFQKEYYVGQTVGELSALLS